MEQLLATPHAALDAARYRGRRVDRADELSPTLAGTTERRLVFIARYDADNADGDGNRFTGGDAGLLWMRVSIEGQPADAVETLIAS